jgi:hypothetical protein
MPGTKSSTPDRESNQDRGHNRQEDIRKVAKILRGGNYSHGPVGPPHQEGPEGSQALSAGPLWGGLA